ncbi:hypothetical protein GCM10011487_46930 [Steroidobacter agaridevorans]|uniref:Uncharacterized protein n=1 Tax=Steroidobacter agaridevorans TaxID=2695856 RepID=A0A829YIJ9_9GAMM|nr:hypothetical protein [Steroidobacter agaridevorans]GFE82693.1 hypothetical protein GCM10011487_46930 [Steroidobacter agaridevorans]GFE85780.1 hypothetical protein GCM10011488_07340 [Steroidobacter agaridevorans]
MRQFSTHQLLSLLDKHGPPCISLYQYTHRHHPDSLQDPIRYRNLLREMESSLLQKYDRKEVRPLLEKFQPLSHDGEFWNHRTDGLAMLAAPDMFEVFELQRPVQENLIVADTFYLKPLLRISQSADRFQILCLTRDRAQLYEGNRDAVDPVELIDTPGTITEALGADLTQQHQSVRSAAGQTPIYHGVGQKKEEVDRDRDRFFRAVDRGVMENHSKPTGLPLMLVALKEYHTPFRNLSRNPHLLSMGVDVDPGAIGLDELRALTWEQMEPLYLERLALLVREFEIARTRQLGFDDLSEVAAATAAGRVANLLVEADRQIPGRVDLEFGRIEQGVLHDPEVGDVLSDLAGAVLRMKGQVVIVPKERMPTDTGVAATCRF